MRVWILARLTLTLVAFWLVVHGPRWPAPRGRGEAPSLEATIVGVGLASGMLLFVYVVGRFLVREGWRPLPWLGAPPAPWAHTAAGVIGLAWMIDGGAQAMGWLEGSSLDDLHRLFAGLDLVPRLGAGVFLGLAPGIAEELCFRGWLMLVLERVAGARVALVASSLVFGLFHFDPLHAVLAGSLGAVLGLSVLRTGTLGPAIFAHALNNFLAVVGAGLRDDTVLFGGLTVCGAVMFGWGLRGLLSAAPSRAEAAP